MSVNIILDMTDSHPTDTAYTPIKANGSYEASIIFANTMIRRALRGVIPDFSVRITTPAMYKHFDWLDGLDGVTINHV